MNYSTSQLVYYNNNYKRLNYGGNGYKTHGISNFGDNNLVNNSGKDTFIVGINNDVISYKCMCSRCLYFEKQVH